MQKSSTYRVLFLASWYPSRLMPKNGNFVQRHAQAVARYADVASLHVISDEAATDFEIDVQKNVGVYEVIVYYPKSTKWRPDKKFTKYLEAHRLGFAHLKTHWGKVDITHLNVSYPAGLFALELKKQYNIPYIITENWTAFLPINPYEFKMYEKYFINQIGQSASAFCPVSEDLKNAFKDFGFDGPFYVIPNVANTELFSHTKRPKSEILRILHVSTFKDDHKNISGILRVIARLCKERDDFQVTMAGNRFGDKYNSQIKSLEIPDEKLTIHPIVPLDKVARMMQEHHIFLLFSNYENLPCVVVEALSTGMVVIGSDVGGTAEMINDRNGHIIQAQDEDALYEKLKVVLDSYNSYDTKVISQQAANRYSYDNVGKAFLNVYAKVLDGKEG